jgi:hypothetical protein
LSSVSRRAASSSEPAAIRAESVEIEEHNMQPGAIVGHRQRVDKPIPTTPNRTISNRETKLLETPQTIENKREK